jgi:hypothetical protein
MILDKYLEINASPPNYNPSIKTKLVGIKKAKNIRGKEGIYWWTDYDHRGYLTLRFREIPKLEKKLNKSKNNKQSRRKNNRKSRRKNNRKSRRR